MIEFDWHDYLVLARELAGRDDEAARHSAVSRAYYAAFSLARQWLEREGTALDADGSIHAQVWEAFRSSPDDISYYIGIDGNSLRNYRNLADYESEVANLDKRVRQAIRKAENVINSVGRLSTT